jgi:hypothetical protein
MNNYEITLLNLKIISKIPKNGKIAKSESGIIIEYNTIPFLTSLKRYYYGDSRNKAINDINCIINNGIEIIEQLKTRHDTINQTKITCLLFHIEKCIIGLNNLKITYINDITMSSKLDILITKIYNYIELYKNPLSNPSLVYEHEQSSSFSQEPV